MALALSLLSNPNKIDPTNNMIFANGDPVPDLNPDTGNPWTRKELRAAGVKGKTVSEYLNSYALFLLVADYLDDYNNGIVGPGHADG